jgi:hypothetical protein
MKETKKISELNNIEVFNSLLSGIDSRWRPSLIEIFKSVCDMDNKFSDIIWSRKNNITGRYVIEYILPAIRKVWANFFITPPTIFDPEYNGQLQIPFSGKLTELKKVRLEIYQLLFDLNELTNIISEKFKKLIPIIELEFSVIDIYSSVLGLITDEYISSKVKECMDIGTDYVVLSTNLRELKLKKIIRRDE